MTDDFDDLYNRPEFTRPEWYGFTPCAEKVDLFFSEDKSERTLYEAAKLCQYQCEHRRECAELSMQATEYGMWAGTQEKLRRRARREGWSVDKLLAQADEWFKALSKRRTNAEVTRRLKERREAAKPEPMI